MSIRFSIKLRGINRVVSNLDSACVDCSKTCPGVSEIVDCRVTGERRRRAQIETHIGTLYLCSNETVKSARLFRERVRAFVEVLPFIVEIRDKATRDASHHMHRLIHNLITLNARTIQTVYRIVPQDVFGERDRESLVRAVTERLSDPERTALLVISLLRMPHLRRWSLMCTPSSTSRSQSASACTEYIKYLCWS